MLRVLDCGRKLILVKREFHLALMLQNDEKVPKRKVKETVELVTLVDSNDKILGLKPKTDAEKLARKLNLSLQRVHDTKFGKTCPAYKLVPSSEAFKSDENKVSQSSKKLPINNRISDHDLEVKVGRIKTWLKKKSDVYVVISGSERHDVLGKAVFEKMKEKLNGESRILDVKHKDGCMKFLIMPPKALPVPLKKQDSKIVESEQS